MFIVAKLKQKELKNQNYFLSLFREFVATKNQIPIFIKIFINEKNHFYNHSNNNL